MYWKEEYKSEIWNLHFSTPCLYNTADSAHKHIKDQMHEVYTNYILLIQKTNKVEHSA